MGGEGSEASGTRIGVKVKDAIGLAHSVNHAGAEEGPARRGIKRWAI